MEIPSRVRMPAPRNSRVVAGIRAHAQTQPGSLVAVTKLDRRRFGLVCGQSNC